jgi:DNA-binding MarR family transcriptional regulator
MRYDQNRSTVAIRSFASYRTDELIALAKLCECAVVSTDEPADYLFTDLSSVSDGTKEEWSEIADYLHRHGARALVWIGMDQIETAYGELPPERCEFLIDADDALAVPIMARANRRAGMDQLHEKGRDGEYRDLHRISDELADFARTLARIAEQDESPLSQLRDKPVSFRAAPASLFEPIVPAPVDTEAVKVRNLIKLRRLRDQHFDASLFADPGWDILLDLYAAKLEGKAVSVSSLCIAAAVPPTTGLRWITTMTEHGALVRRQDPNDARRVFIELSAESEDRMRAFFADSAARGGMPI